MAKLRENANPFTDTATGGSTVDHNGAVNWLN
jgi:hypothetical protein